MIAIIIIAIIIILLGVGLGYAYYDCLLPAPAIPDGETAIAYLYSEPYFKGKVTKVYDYVKAIPMYDIIPCNSEDKSLCFKPLFKSMQLVKKKNNYMRVISEYNKGNYYSIVLTSKQLCDLSNINRVLKHNTGETKSVKSEKWNYTNYIVSPNTLIDNEMGNKKINLQIFNHLYK